MNNSSINALHINYSDNSGGAARSAYKIHSGLKELGCTSRMLVRWKVTEDSDVGDIRSQNSLVKFGDGIGRKVIDRWLNLQYLYYPSSFALLEHPWFQSADIVQIYNIHGFTGFFTYRALPKISNQKPIVWRLSDMWPLTGHCSYSYECDRWKTGCGACPHLDEYPALSRDTTALLWRIKKEVYKRSKIVLVATNSWMERVVQESPLLGHFPVHIIPNGINTNIFHPISQVEARNTFDIPSNRKVVLFAGDQTWEIRKGGQYVNDVMQKVAASGVENLTLVVMGKGANSWADDPNYQTIRIDFTSNDQVLANAYAAADVYLHPAIVENFPNSVLESMGCGTTCVAFNTGGVSDVVRHLETGYLARYKDIDDLAEGVKLLLGNKELLGRLSDNCQRLIAAEYTLERQAQRHADLYNQLLDSVH
ncbi:MAG: glycosyltransferase [Okeania sp. SIO3B5]|uniref:glycosyltransferase family 4 protein n=1 Tax=Okeania sp. SIO3B5 TaxID=2607811 RepID=UPI0014004C8E|nr:glycosyltransferase family 4 protein [Okeania sp. SIO3B5]NEO57397.1 glycosyltransferase [Okeania sp. SIO3B5]